MKVAFIGLSHLGIVSSAAGAAKGFHVLGFDPDEKLCRELTAGRLPIVEPGLDDLYKAGRNSIRFSSNPADLADCDLAFFSLDVPTDASNRSDLKPLRSLIESAAIHLPPRATKVILSQVPPGFVRSLQKPDWHGQVETLIFGAAVERAMKPERFIVGCTDPSQPLPPAYQQWLDAFGAPILKMRYESAELAKIAINLFLTSSVATTNTLAELCEKIGADWTEIVASLRLDARIGPRAYLTPGLGLAGGNLERDLQTFRSLANEHGSDFRLIEAWQANSDHRRHWALRILSEKLPRTANPPRLAIWGLAYKENTHSVKNSASLALVEALPHLEKHAYDPRVSLPTDSIPHFTRHPDPMKCCEGAAALAIMTPWPEFRNASLVEIRKRMTGRLLLDPHGLLDRNEARRLDFDYFRLG